MGPICTDFRKVNAVTKGDAYPLSCLEDCIDEIGDGAYISTFDMLKGYWQVPLTERAKEVSAFVTPFGTFRCLRMSFGMKNSASTFQHLMDDVVRGLKKTRVYIDDLIVVSPTWEAHLVAIESFFEHLIE